VTQGGEDSENKTLETINSRGAIGGGARGRARGGRGGGGGGGRGGARERARGGESTKM